MRPPVPPFTEETARQKVQAAEDAWNTCDPERVAGAYESRDADGQWWRSDGNEQWEFDAEGSLARREASINDVRIDESQRRIDGPRAEADRDAGIPLR